MNAHEIVLASARLALMPSGVLWWPERRVLVDCVLERQARNVRFWAEFLARPATAPATSEQMTDRIEWSRREYAHLFTHREVFDRALA